MKILVTAGNTQTPIDQVRCTCLLSPRCFHVLACLTRLEVALVEAAPAPESELVARLYMYLQFVTRNCKLLSLG